MTGPEHPRMTGPEHPPGSARGFDFPNAGTHQPLLDRLHLRPYQPGDEQQILPLFNTVFRAINPEHVDRDLTTWTWIYLDNPAGTRIHLALEQSGSIVGQWAGIPVRCHTPFGERCFVQIVDTLVHPDYRKGQHEGPGVFAAVGRRGIEHWMTHFGDAALYGYPVPIAERMGQRFLGYRHLRVVDYLCRALPAVAPSSAHGEGDPQPITTARITTARITTARITTLGDEVDALWAQLAATQTCLLIRDRSYLQWRYLDSPGARYELHTARRDGALVGLMVLRPRHELVAGACTIADWMVPGGADDIVDALLAVAEARGREHGRRCLMAAFADHAPEHAAWRGRGFGIVSSGDVLERRLTYWIGPFSPEITDGLLADSWWYTLGDSDLV